MLGARLVSSLEMFLGIISNNGPNKYYTCYLGGVIVSINNKLIINRDIPNSEVRVLSIAKFFSFWISRRQVESFLFLENNTKIYKERMLLELELDNKLVPEELLSKIISLGFCFNFFVFFFLFFLKDLRVFEEY
jgi:hypothetical protein